MVFGVLAGGLANRMRLAFTLVFAGVFLMTSAPAYADDVKAWQKQIVKKIVKSHIYPRSAIAREIEGRARVSVTIDRSGAITNFEVVEPTGKSQLDKVIPKMMDKMNPLPAPPESLPDANLTFTIPIAWRLQ